MSLGVWDIVMIVILAGAFFGLVAYRTWQDRREERQSRGSARTEVEGAIRKPA